MTIHEYATTLTWSGSTGVGYEAYDRTHRVEPHGAAAITMSSDPAFRGDPAYANPEQLLLAAASSCQLLSFLAVAARARIDVVAYADEATAIMPEDDGPIQITEIVLRPRITVRGDTTRIPRLVEIAHKECFIAKSLTVRMRIDPVTETA
ncbi:osmotically inducible protein OsmC [Enemella dayhoffiae]|uniref:Osmotically inducible protein OsmC n=1 Tax=Enemella dayhoffiae TaxID=2016507 RepID=A0A255HDS2_9ACTN|nr:OsmC family protein [Enemella dayhoffiae]OYO25203.1 osmotically inducible protein OsmC [Enemella dayhoffiae]